MDPFSGPKGSPLDAKVYPSNIYQPVPADRVADPNNVSTGALATGIGFGLSVGVSGQIDGAAGISPQNVRVPGVERTANFGQGYQPGLTDTAGVAATDARFVAIGGGRSTITAGTGTDWSKGISNPNPFTPVPIMAFGMGGSRDGGAGPGVVLNGTLDATKNLVPLHQFGSASAASVAPTLEDAEDEGEESPPPARSASKGDDEKPQKEFNEGLKKELEKKPIASVANQKK
jgi:hypothetical protein